MRPPTAGEKGRLNRLTSPAETYKNCYHTNQVNTTNRLFDRIRTIVKKTRISAKALSMPCRKIPTKIRALKEAGSTSARSSLVNTFGFFILRRTNATASGSARGTGANRTEAAHRTLKDRKINPAPHTTIYLATKLQGESESRIS